MSPCMKPMLFMRRYVDRHPFLQDQGTLCTLDLPGSANNEHLVLPSVSVKRSMTFRIKAEQAHGEIFRAVLFRDQRAQIDTLHPLLLGQIHRKDIFFASDEHLSPLFQAVFFKN